MFGTQVNALIAFLRREALALTKAKLIHLSKARVSNAKGFLWGTLMPRPRAAIKFANAPAPG